MIKVVLVESHLLLRQGVRAILESEDDLDVVGEAGDSSGTLRLVQEEQPDVLLLDAGIPGGSATATVRQIRKISPETRTVILSAHDGPELVRSLFALGVGAYLPKSVGRHELVAAIRSVVADSSRVLLSVSPTSLRFAENEPSGALSQRERDVLQLVAQAMSNAQIASRLSLTEGTVKRHLRRIFIKLEAVSRLDAVNKAVAAAQINSPSLTSPELAWQQPTGA
jgi:DNA-binding NarL/FixJ family response regulator